MNHGKGIAVGGTVWAPVNCGYKAAATDADGNVTDKGFPYGKLYQWGRKYGQGHSIDYDSSVPTFEVGPVYGQSESMCDYFFTSESDWITPHDDSMWNSGTEESPVKTEYDPCPDGWRVPTYAELNKLTINDSEWTTDENGHKGCCFSCAPTIIYDTPLSGEDSKVFLPAAGYRNQGGEARLRGDDGFYWSSGPDLGYGANYLNFTNGFAAMDVRSRASGCSVRCVQVTDEVADL